MVGRIARTGHQELGPLTGNRPTGSETVFVPVEAIAELQREHGERAMGAAGLNSISRPERAAIVREGKALAQENGHSLLEIARRIATQRGYCVWSVYWILTQHSKTHPDDPIARATDRPKPGEAKIIHSWEKGEGTRSIAKHCHCPETTVRRIIRAHRLRRIQDLPLEYIPNEQFEGISSDGKREREVLGPMPEPDEPPKKVRIPSGLPPYLASLYEAPLLTREQEVHLFRKMNYLKFEACRLAATLDLQNPKSETMYRIEALFDEATTVRNDIIRANLRLVVSVAKKYVDRSKPEDFFEKISDGNISLMRAVDKFDFARGNKFSTYATWAIMKNFARTIPTELRRSSREQSGHMDYTFEETADERGDPDVLERAQQIRGQRLAKLFDRLDEREQAIISARFGLGQAQEPQTLKQVGETMGVTKERVRQIEARALTKLRRTAKEEGITFDGLLGDLPGGDGDE